MTEVRRRIEDRLKAALAPIQIDIIDDSASHAGHDFPQRIEYAREGDVLTATISTMDRTREFSWSWTRQD